MPTRRRTNLSRSTAGARRKRLLRASETKTQRELRLKVQRERTSSARASETVEQRDNRRQTDRARKARFIAAQREQIRVADRKRSIALLQEMSRQAEEREQSPAHERRYKSRDRGPNNPPSRQARRGGADRKRLAPLGEKDMPAQRKRLTTDTKRHSQTREQRSVGDSEIFIKTAVSQWLDKVKRQVYKACSRVTVKTEEVFGDEAVSDSLFTVEEGIVPKMEADEENANVTEVSDSALPDCVAKQVELFVYADKDCSSRTNGIPEESDPLGIDTNLVPSSLITISDGGVLREENYCTSSNGRKNMVNLNKVKVESSDGELETLHSAMAET